MDPPTKAFLQLHETLYGAFRMETESYSSRRMENSPI